MTVRETASLNLKLKLEATAADGVCVCVCAHTSSSTDWNSLSSAARSIRTVPWLEQWNVRYGFPPAGEPEQKHT